MTSYSVLARRIACLVTPLLLVLACATSEPEKPADSGTPLSLHSSLKSREQLRQNTNTAKNVILFIGDGMGPTTVTAARIFDGQSRGRSGEEHSLPFDDFPNVALIKTYTTNTQVSDSAGTATAMNSGKKTRSGVIGIGPEALRRSCEGSLAHPLQTMGEIAEDKGKATGIVTTARITHATPAAVYAHSAERDWESDEFMPEDVLAAGCRDMARQLVEFSSGDGIDVILGGGLREFLGTDKGGRRQQDDADLVSDWLNASDNRSFVSNATELAATNPGGQVMGLFTTSHMTYVSERAPDSVEPQLAEMTAKAIDLLSANENGYYLMVEGGRIDHGHHDGYAGFAMLEAQEFARAVEVALAKVDLDETLVMVTADHSHAFTMAGYPTRGNPILGLVTGNDLSGEPASSPMLAVDGMPYTTLGYANGPGAVMALPRPMPETGVHAMQQSLIRLDWDSIDGTVWPSETHGGEDVALYAIGPWSHLAGGVLEQHAIFHLMTHAFGW